MKKGVNIMARLSKYDLCEKCCQIFVAQPGQYSHLPNGQTIEQFFFDSEGFYQNQDFGIGLLISLKEKGGCRDCINLLRRITGD